MKKQKSETNTNANTNNKNGWNWFLPRFTFPQTVTTSLMPINQIACVTQHRTGTRFDQQLCLSNKIIGTSVKLEVEASTEMGGILPRDARETKTLKNGGPCQFKSDDFSGFKKWGANYWIGVTEGREKWRTWKSSGTWIYMENLKLWVLGFLWCSLALFSKVINLVLNFDYRWLFLINSLLCKEHVEVLLR